MKFWSFNIKFLKNCEYKSDSSKYLLWIDNLINSKNTFSNLSSWQITNSFPYFFCSLSNLISNIFMNEILLS